MVPSKKTGGICDLITYPLEAAELAKNNLRRLNRHDLLKILIELSEENKRLREEIQRLERQANYPEVAIEDPESIDEVVAQLTGLFRYARETCDVYIEHTKQRCLEMEAQAQAACPQVASEENSPVVEEPMSEPVQEDEELCVCQGICLRQEFPKTEREDSV